MEHIQAHKALYKKARELGWTGPEVVPVWQQYEQERVAQERASMPDMIDLDNL